ALAVVVAADQVAGLGAEGDEPAVGADRGVERAGVARDVAGGVDADHLRRGRGVGALEVAEEYVGGASQGHAAGRGVVPVTRAAYEVAGGAAEGDPAAAGPGGRL